MHYCSLIGQFVKNYIHHVSSVQFNYIALYAPLAARVESLDWRCVEVAGESEQNAT